MTSVFSVTVADGEPVLGIAEDGPEAIGLVWVTLPEVVAPTGTVPVPPMIVAVPAIARQHSTTT
jgi:hypothetical protein